jgi:hypothetical protein
MNIDIIEKDIELLKEHIVDKLKDKGISQELININMDVIEDISVLQFDNWFTLYGIEDSNEIANKISEIIFNN